MRRPLGSAARRFAGPKLVGTPPGGYRVVPTLGQSNALGAGKGRAPVDDGEHVHQLVGCGRHRGRLAAARETAMWHHELSRHVGFTGTFARGLHAETGQHVLTVPCAAGESGFRPSNGCTWSPGDTTTPVNLWRFARDQMRAALATHPANELTAILWHQGENDVPYMSTDEYADHLTAAIDALRAEFGLAPFLIGQMSPDRMDEGHLNYPAIDRAHRQVACALPDVAFVPAPVGMTNGPGEHIHFSAAGQVELGRRYLAALHTL